MRGGTRVTQKEFWEHIQKSKRRDSEEHAERLVARLAKLRAVEIIDFGHWWDQTLRQAHNWNLWGAAYLINGGCSDDGFDYFCQWLILQGREVFTAAVKNPDTLASVVKPDEEFYECGSFPATDAWFRATGIPDNEKGYDALSAAEEARHGEPKPAPPLKTSWDHDDDAQMRKRFPKLSALYLDRDGDE
jgi:hypothetical protein